MTHPSIPHLGSLAYVEALLESYLADPASVSEDWRAYFRSLDRNGGVPRAFKTRPGLEPGRLFAGEGGSARAARLTEEARLLQHKVDEMVRTFRMRGHLAAQVNPLHEVVFPAELEAAAFGLTDRDFDEVVSTHNLPGPDEQRVSDLYRRMRNTYCRSIGVEFMHIDDLEARYWLQQHMEVQENRIDLPRETQVRILRRLTAAAVFEQFIQKKYLGAKSFSLEGAESLIPLLDLAIEKAGTQDCKEIVFGMAHRGRLNVLANILGKSPQSIFREFEDADPEHYFGRGDVKYHLGHSSDWTTVEGKTVHLSLSFNPSHLEYIDPVVLGRIRAKQDRLGDHQRRAGMAVLIHGDAAFAGEGVVQETLNLSQLSGYCVGGTLHVMVNNQVGFTTGPHEARSNTYATDVAKMLQIPILHVNGEDPEAVAQVVELALDYRQEFQRDVVIDMYCYRRRGHNEGDEPAFTQPLLYREIRERQPVRVHYLDHLLALGKVTREEAEDLIEAEEKALEAALENARQSDRPSQGQAYAGLWEPYRGGPDEDQPDVETAIDAERAKHLLEGVCTIPEGFTPHPKIERLLQARREAAAGERGVDWASAELLAFASLATAGTRIRMSGQDTERGTFSQRHAVLHDVESGALLHTLNTLAADQAPVEILNSPLSEAGVLGFEYGYSLDYPDGLVLWEAQFGDFCNAAQVVIDQFLVSAEDKWNRLSGLALLLPHGFEGQGPEHSSARLERWLTLAAEDNIQVASPTTPAQYFHLLRRQVLRPIRKPLVVMTPKSLLRHPEVVSDIGELAAGSFHRVLDDPAAAERASEVRRILLCSGKVYYDLAERRRQLDDAPVAILRLEQLYPLRAADLERALAPYAPETAVLWVQEEPRNMGAWPFLRLQFADRLLGRWRFSGVYRHESASPATGSAQSHKIEQDELLSSAFADL
ncbi:MAG TPA: 2-oxoglutarate dehydrogenase E1 component [Thermoanaerobaculia bacterium]|nr:2-oxoglutarate dehydrogenase E1 component [Thermoanaerobaculia bacterium]